MLYHQHITLNMKNYIIILFTITGLFFSSCSSDDNGGESTLTGKGNITLTFDNGYAGNDLILGTPNPANANGEQLTITRFSYIVSNFGFTSTDGETYTYPKDESYFIINQEAEIEDVALSAIPAGEYTAVTFGVGVDAEKYNQGAEGQGDFLTLAEESDMMWSWLAGYKFLNFEGSFTSATVTEATDFKIHMGSHGSSLDNYKEVTLNLPTHLLVSEDMESNIHLKIDANVILNGQYNISLSDKAVIMVDEEKSPQIATNTSGMFTVDHVHNGSGH